ncbi:hypothetical protein DPEC_G00304540 [Dallia pectoralis]|uniref:Uncharacterized protein n=1 Tax=Dallia pectoralis TaxID=75939 RepID=A0ACC2FDF7_DALPE|nr:hypothetical protein DPEC_G00304540 [Dallia pectoralis]
MCVCRQARMGQRTPDGRIVPLRYPLLCLAPIGEGRELLAGRSWPQLLSLARAPLWLWPAASRPTALSFPAGLGARMRPGTERCELGIPDKQQEVEASSLF